MEDGLSSRQHRQRERQQRYRLRVLACLAASLLLAVAAVRLWPVPPAAAPVLTVTDDAPAVSLREVTQTQHARRAAPPPPPPPVPLVEVDDYIEQEPLDLTVELAPDRSADEAPPGPESTRDGEAESPQAAVPGVGARLLRIPELSRTEAARRKGIRARVDVEVVIAVTGRVEEAHIVQRVLLADSEDGRPQQNVSVLGYGLEEAALDAARRTLFRPARAGGKAVKSRKTLTLTFEPGD